MATQEDDEKLEIKVVRTLEEFRDALKIRHDVFGLDGYFDTSKYKGYEYDDYDILPVATIMLALLDKKPVGTVRLIMDSEKGLPINREFDFGFLRKEGVKLAEGSRIAVLPEHRGRKNITYGLLKADIIYAFMKGVTDIVSVGNLGTKRGFNVAEQVFLKLGYIPVGEPFYYHAFDEEALPMVLRRENIKGRFRSFMEEDSDFIEKPYNTCRL